MSAAKILIHTCCAPCFIAPYQELKAEGRELSAWWYNPNIHPLLEYQKRRNTLREFCNTEQIKLIEHDEYGLKSFLENTLDRIDTRCEYCYRVRLEALVKDAVQYGYDAISTTLLYSRYQKHEMIISIAAELCKGTTVEFFYRDWRPLWQEGIALSKAAGMYRQQYCGCIFSEEDRYHEQIPGNRAK
ncbi:MAG: epoxyqueuosine reductase QueH [Candidatus Cloacimonetes bacterium]|nr:epoxyqueuosine reductase QueH [Candidatus Cloacimonadota bacterium]